MVLHQVVDKGQTAAFASQRAVADACKVGVSVETVALEHGHHTLVFHLAVLDDGLEDEFPVGVHVLQAVPRDGPQELGNGEHGA